MVVLRKHITTITMNSIQTGKNCKAGEKYRNTYCITKTYLYDFDHLIPHFYLVKLGFTWVYIISLISAQNIDCGYSLEPPRRGGSNEYHKLCFVQKFEKYLSFLSENFQFMEMKFSIYLNMHVFVMESNTNGSFTAADLNSFFSP